MGLQWLRGQKSFSQSCRRSLGFGPSGPWSFMAAKKYTQYVLKEIVYKRQLLLSMCKILVKHKIKLKGQPCGFVYHKVSLMKNTACTALTNPSARDIDLMQQIHKRAPLRLHLRGRVVPEVHSGRRANAHDVPRWKSARSGQGAVDRLRIPVRRQRLGFGRVKSEAMELFQ